jgi:4-hydroxybenzoate decarboxylase subunit C
MTQHLHLNLRSFIDALRAEGELKVVEEPVDPCLELAEIQRRVVARQGPALLFTRVRGSDFPVATNLFGTPKRMDLAFGGAPLRFVRRLVEAAETLMPPSVSKLWGFRDLAGAALRTGLRGVPAGPVLDRVIDPPQLGMLPQLKSWPEDGGPFLTLPLVYTEHPRTGKGNLGMYRVQLYDSRTAGMHIQIHRGGGFHHHEAEKAGAALPVNVFLGGPPALTLSAVAPLPENIPELVLASLLQGERLRLIRNSRCSSLPIVAEADFALVGHIPPGVRRPEGPFGDHYGYYSLRHDFPVFEVDRMYHRKDAIFPATVVGRPRQEDHYIGDYLQQMFSPLFPLVMNGVSDVWAYDDAGMHPLAAAVVRERYRREAFMAALRILGEGQLSLTKFLVVTDEPLPLRNFSRVLRHVLARADFETDLFVFSNVSQDTLDYSTRRINEGSKAILMGTGESRFALRETPVCPLKNPGFQRQKVFLPGVLVVEGPKWKENDDAIARLLGEEAVDGFRLVCLVDDAEDCARDEASFLWTVFTRMEPAADIHSRQPKLERYHVRLSAPVLFDCRIKPWFPPVVEPDPGTVARVDQLWMKMFGK